MKPVRNDGTGTRITWAPIVAAMAGLLACQLASPAHGAECDVTYHNVVEGYATLGVGEVGSYQDVSVEPTDPKRQALVREGMYVADYDTVHVFGTSDFISYVFTLNDCVVAEVRWVKGHDLKGTPS